MVYGSTQITALTSRAILSAQITDLRASVDWRPEFGQRVFWYDAFLSHNRSDWSGRLSAKLEALGVRTYHDADSEIRDERVLVTVEALEYAGTADLAAPPVARGGRNGRFIPWIYKSEFQQSRFGVAGPASQIRSLKKTAKARCQTSCSA